MEPDENNHASIPKPSALKKVHKAKGNRSSITWSSNSSGPSSSDEVGDASRLGPQQQVMASPSHRRPTGGTTSMRPPIIDQFKPSTTTKQQINRKSPPTGLASTSGPRRSMQLPLSSLSVRDQPPKGPLGTPTITGPFYFSIKPCVDPPFLKFLNFL